MRKVTQISPTAESTVTEHPGINHLPAGRHNVRNRVLEKHCCESCPGLQRSLLSLLLSFLLLCGGLQPAVAQTSDPWQGFNQRIHTFNSVLDEAVLRPVATVYDTMVPRVVRQGIGNFFSNIDDINVFVNDLLQLKFKDAASDSGRFLINTTVGLGGVIDVASPLGLQKNEEDFGQTFGRWSVAPGPYVVLPFLGPSTLRDSFGRVLDTMFDPLQYSEDSARATLWTLDQLDSRASVLSMQDLISGDEYLFMRDAYLQRRRYLVSDGDTGSAGDDWDNFGSDDFDDFDDFDTFGGPAEQEDGGASAADGAIDRGEGDEGSSDNGDEWDEFDF